MGHGSGEGAVFDSSNNLFFRVLRVSTGTVSCLVAIHLRNVFDNPSESTLQVASSLPPCPFSAYLNLSVDWTQMWRPCFSPTPSIVTVCLSDHCDEEERGDGEVRGSGERDEPLFPVSCRFPL